jgi:glycerophosphoryl diester phosphodiesterase
MPNTTTHILTHRGLDPAIANYFLESSAEAFEDQLKRGYGLEFDVQITKDNQIIISHDNNLKRISNNTIHKNIKELTLKELTSLSFNDCHLISLEKLLQLLELYNGNKISALHLKYTSQTPDVLNELIKQLQQRGHHDDLIIFDVTHDTAIYLKHHIPTLKLAPSVAHPYDIERYNHAVGGTLWNLEDVLKNHELFDWVWLDEWDLSDKNETKKYFYQEEVFSACRAGGFKIALVSPELHASSPGLLGGEAHPDAANLDLLHQRMHAILKLEPDAVCTDYPDMMKNLVTT